MNSFRWFVISYIQYSWTNIKSLILQTLLKLTKPNYMKKIILFLIIGLNLTNSYSQSLEEKIAIKACECLKSKKEVNDDVYRECISTSMSNVVLSSKNQKDREAMNTVEGIQNMFKKVHEIMPKTCKSEVQKESDKITNEHYSYSKNESAKNSYIVAKDAMENKNYKVAIEGFQIALKQDNQFVLAYDDIAMCYRQLNDYDNAIKNYEKSLKIYPEGDFALVNIAVVYSLKSDIKNAVKYYEMLIKYQPNNPEGYFGAGQNYFTLNDYEKALDNIFIAHRIYTEENSDYAKDTEQVIGMMYQKLKTENKEELFKKIAKKNNIEIN
jgi:tetratricopeptide (TPR) repeat protein